MAEVPCERREPEKKKSADGSMLPPTQVNGRVRTSARNQGLEKGRADPRPG
jgi:type II secretory pathway component PulM